MAMESEAVVTVAAVAAVWRLLAIVLAVKKPAAKSKAVGRAIQGESAREREVLTTRKPWDKWLWFLPWHVAFCTFRTCF